MNNKRENYIDRRNFGYQLLKKYVCLCLTKFFYRRFTITFDEPVPGNVPVVFAANHQNALIDALVIICSTDRNPVFFARADIFKSKFVRKVLYFLKIAPLFRIRDGRETMQQNTESFDLATEILSRNSAIGIFPEGTHTDKEHLIPLKKGMARMVLQAEQMKHFQLGVHVIPVSIAYIDYIRPRSEVHIHFGKPLIFTQLKELYESNPSQALLKFNEIFEEALKSIVINVESEESHSIVQSMRKSMIYEKLGAGARLKDSFHAAREFIGKINTMQRSDPQHAQTVLNTAREYYSALESKGISEPILFKGGLSFFTSVMLILILTAGFPIYITGRILNYLPFMLMYRYVNRKIADTQFRSSVYFAATALFFAPILYILQAIAIGVIFSSFMLCIASLPVMLLLGIAAYQYLKIWKWSKMRWKANIFVRRHKSTKNNLVELRKKMLEELNKLNNFSANK
jgi:1-acyl-sn-glycerol-3-phosphate acyltransferase